jgi:hypothetical protein
MMFTFNFRLFTVTNLVAAASVLAPLGCSSDGDGSPAAGGSSSTGGSTSSGGSSGTTGGTSGTTGGSSSTTGGSSSGTLHGHFTATLKAEELGAPPYTKFAGQFFNSVNPDTFQLKVDKEQNGCRLMVPNSVFCDPDCMDGVCTGNNQCTPYPAPVYVGVAHLTGIGASEVTIDADAPAYSYQPSAALPNPPCAEGAAVSVTTDKFSVTGKCISALDLKGADPLPVETGKSLPLTWTPPAVAGNTRIKIYLDVAHHGGKKGEIDCDVPDTGSFEIPEPLITRLVGLGLAGFPTIEVTRYSSAVSDKESEVKLEIASFVSRSVETGVKSCASDSSQCPTGQTCQDDLTCK